MVTILLSALKKDLIEKSRGCGHTIGYSIIEGGYDIQVIGGHGFKGNVIFGSSHIKITNPAEVFMMMELLWEFKELPISDREVRELQIQEPIAA